MDIDRFLYWFLTREPGQKLLIAGSVVLAFFLFLLFVFAVAYSLV
jgi:hypothetical protein